MNNSQMLLPDLIRATENACKKAGYGSLTLEDCRDSWNAFRRYSESIGELYFREQIVAQFLKELYDYPESRPKSRMACAMIRALRMMGDYKLFGRFLTPHTREHPTTDDFQVAVSNYYTVCAKRNNQASTMKRRQYTLNHVLEHFIKLEVLTCADIMPEHISTFVSSLAGHSKKSVDRELQTLRDFLNSMFLFGQRQDDLSLCVPKLYFPKNEKLPSGWSDDELNRIFAAIDRGNPKGKRDYCIVLLAARCGLRTGDLKSLLLENIKWEQGCIEFVQAKTLKKNRLPLPEDVGLAIIDYLKYSRPQTGDQHLFVKLTPPYDGISSPYILFKEYVVKAGIKLDKNRPHGLHSLRHTLATRLLENDVPLNVISSILGHTSPESVKPYLKIDIPKLKECALQEKQLAEVGQ